MMRTRLLLVAALLASAIGSPASALQPIAWYPLQSDGLDALGLNEAMDMRNVPFQDGGAWCAGDYRPSGGYYLGTPFLGEMDFDSFAVSVDFRIDEPLGATYGTRPIIMCGGSSRFLGAYVQGDGTIALKYNNQEFRTSTRTIATGSWHSLVIAYERSALVGTLYLDGELTCSESFDMAHSGDRYVMAIDGSTNGSFRGTLRHLVVYDSAFDPTPVVETTWGGIKALFD